MPTNKQKLMAGLITLAAASTYTISESGLNFISRWESGGKVYTEAYKDIVGVPTICDGITRGVTMGMKVTPEKCQTLLKEESSISGKVVGKYVRTPITQGQYDILVDFVHHYGETKFRGSTLLKKINEGDCAGAGYQFTVWNKVKINGVLVVNKGIQKRANERRDIWMEGCTAW